MYSAPPEVASSRRGQESESSSPNLRPLPYPPFGAPEELAQVGRERWSPKQAEAYAEWFHSVKNARIDFLLKYVGEAGRTIDEKLIQDLGEHFKRTLPEPQFSGPSLHGPVLTDRGYGMAADAGLVGARFLQTRYPHLQWTVVRKPRSDISYNLPVLTGFGTVPLDPVLISINQAHALLAGKRDVDAWLSVWKHWGELAERYLAEEHPLT